MDGNASKDIPEVLEIKWVWSTMRLKVRVRFEFGDLHALLHTIARLQTRVDRSPHERRTKIPYGVHAVKPSS